MIPGGMELVLIAILGLVIVFVTVAIRKQWYTQLFVNVVFLFGVIFGILGVIDLVKNSETGTGGGIFKISICLLTLLVGGYLQKKKDAVKKETGPAAGETVSADSENGETEA